MWHACRGKKGTVTESSKRTTQLSPQLFDLTSLQREANNKFGFSAKTTLSIAQALYEKHKALTYPRTDSRALPEDYLGTVRDTLAVVAHSPAFAPYAQGILQNNWVKPSRRIFDNSKISDHFAIIPTLQPPASALTEAEQKVYDLVVRRFMAVFYPAAEYDVTTRITKVGEDSFKTEGKVLVKAGWLEIYGKAGGRGRPRRAAGRRGGSDGPYSVGRVSDETSGPLYRSNAFVRNGRRRKTCLRG